MSLCRLRVTGHALADSYRLHHPEAEAVDVMRAWRGGHPVSPEMARALTGRRPPKSSQTGGESEYVLSRDGWGMFVGVRKGLYLTIVTYLRFQATQTEFVRKHFGEPDAPQPPLQDQIGRTVHPATWQILNCHTLSPGVKRVFGSGRILREWIYDYLKASKLDSACPETDHAHVEFYDVNGQQTKLVYVKYGDNWRIKLAPSEPKKKGAEVTTTVGIISKADHCKTHVRELTRLGYRVVNLGPNPATIPPRIDVTVCRRISSSKAAYRLAQDHKQSGATVIFEDGVGGVVSAVREAGPAKESGEKKVLTVKEKKQLTAPALIQRLTSTGGIVCMPTLTGTPSEAISLLQRIGRAGSTGARKNLTKNYGLLQQFNTRNTRNHIHRIGEEIVSDRKHKPMRAVTLWRTTANNRHYPITLLYTGELTLMDLSLIAEEYGLALTEPEGALGQLQLEANKKGTKWVPPVVPPAPPEASEPEIEIEIELVEEEEEKEHSPDPATKPVTCAPYKAYGTRRKNGKVYWMIHKNGKYLKSFGQGDRKGVKEHLKGLVKRVLAKNPPKPESVLGEVYRAYASKTGVGFYWKICKKGKHFESLGYTDRDAVVRRVTELEGSPPTGLPRALGRRKSSDEAEESPAVGPPGPSKQQVINALQRFGNQRDAQTDLRVPRKSWKALLEKLEIEPKLYTQPGRRKELKVPTPAPTLAPAPTERPPAPVEQPAKSSEVPKVFTVEVLARMLGAALRKEGLSELREAGIKVQVVEWQHLNGPSGSVCGKGSILLGREHFTDVDCPECMGTEVYAYMKWMLV